MDLCAIRALVFDAYGTLFDVHSVVNLCEEVAPERGGELSRLWRAKQLEYSWLRSLMGEYEDFWKITQDALQFANRGLELTLAPNQFAQLMSAYLNLASFPEVPEALRSIERLPKAILSNGTPAMLDAGVRHAGLQGAFAHILSVDEVKTFKPSAKVYALAARSFSVDMREILFVSSNSWDIQGAKSFGFQTCWINRANAPAEELGHQADLEVCSLAQLSGLLNEESG